MRQFWEANKMKTIMKISIAIFLICCISGVALAQTMSEKEYNQYLINSLKDENIGIRTSAAQLLGERKVVEAVDPLVKMLKSEKKYGARIIVALALHKIGDKRVLPELKNVAKCDECKSVRAVVTGIIQDMQTVKVAKNKS